MSTSLVQVDECAPVYFVVGDAGNEEGPDSYATTDPVRALCSGCKNPLVQFQTARLRSPTDLATHHNRAKTHTLSFAPPPSSACLGSVCVSCHHFRRRIVLA